MGRYSNRQIPLAEKRQKHRPIVPVRILDGHVVLDRAIAERGRYPPINVLRSVSRTMPACNTAEENAVVDRARRYLATYEDMAELIRLGAYRGGSDATVDEAIRYYPALEKFLSQTKDEKVDLAACYGMLDEILNDGGNSGETAEPPEAVRSAPLPPAGEARQSADPPQPAPVSGD